MPEVSVVVAPNSVDVVGGVSTVNINTTVGETGDRGSNIYVGSGNPNKAETLIPGGTPKVFDMFINMAPDDIDYTYLYQYLNQDGEFTWVRLLRLIPNTFLNNLQETFVNGEVDIFIPVADVIPLAAYGVYQAENFNIQYSILGENGPIASSVKINEISFPNNVASLSITITAVEYSGSAWTALDGEYPVHIVVTVI
jgi:hypothetical protein